LRSTADVRRRLISISEASRALEGLETEKEMVDFSSGVRMEESGIIESEGREINLKPPSGQNRFDKEARGQVKL